jgi:hypothetical protein
MASKTVSADSGSLWQTLLNLWPYMWPAGRNDLKMRVVWATLFLVAAKLLLILVPYFFKWSTDALANDGGAMPDLPPILLAPVMLVVAYNVVRLVQWGFNQLRDASSPASASMRCANLPTRPSSICTNCRCASIWSGALAACRASSSAAPRASRRSCASQSSTRAHDPRICADGRDLCGRLRLDLRRGRRRNRRGLHLVHGLGVRLAHRIRKRDERFSDTDANTKAIDSLLNFETVKYFGNEADGGATASTGRWRVMRTPPPRPGHRSAG